MQNCAQNGFELQAQLGREVSAARQNFAGAGKGQGIVPGAIQLDVDHTTRLRQGRRHAAVNLSQVAQRQGVLQPPCSAFGKKHAALKPPFQPRRSPLLPGQWLHAQDPVVQGRQVRAKPLLAMLPPSGRDRKIYCLQYIDIDGYVPSAFIQSAELPTSG